MRPVSRAPTSQGLRGRLKRLATLVVFVRFVRALSTPLGRGRLRATRRGARLCQPATVTGMDRHPVLFGHVAAELADRVAPRLLSFGCSTGEEAFTLARYLPGARIDAIDANPACIARARATVDARARATVDARPRATVDQPGTDRIRFACADSPDAFAPDRYDAITCLSVLRHGDLEAWRPDTCTALLPFARFAAIVEALDRCLRPGGLLVLWGCNFRFMDTATSQGYRSVATPAMAAQPGPFYGPDDRLLADDRCTGFIFVKTG